MTREDEGPMPGILRSVPSWQQEMFERFLERENCRRRALVAPSALQGLLHGGKIAQQRADARVGVNS